MSTLPTPESNIRTPVRAVPSRRAHWSRLVPFVAFGVFTALLLWPLCIGKALYWGDITFYFQPMAAYSQYHLKQGHIPLWNPYVLCGQPFLGNPQMGIFYPTSMLLSFLPVWLFFTVNTLLHVFLCGAFCFLYLRRWSVRQTSAVAGSLVYMGSSYLIGRLQFPPMILTAAYLPLLLMFLDQCVDSPRNRANLGLCLTVTLMVLAAHTQMAYLSLLCATLYGIMRLWSKFGSRKGWERLRSFLVACLPLCLSGLLGIALTFIQTVPALQLLKASTREAFTPALANRFVFQPQQLWTLFDPHFFGHPAQRDYWGGGNAWEPALFIGWIPLLLIGYAVVRCSTERLVRFWSVLALLGLWMALGNMGGLYWLAFYVVPGLSNFHDPARFLFFTTIGFAVLTTVGMDALRTRTLWCNLRVCRAGLALIALPLIVYGREWNPTTEVTAVREGEQEQKFAEGNALSGRVYLPEHSLDWTRFVTDGYSDYGPASADYVRSLRGTLLPNIPMGQGVAMAAGYEPVPISGAAALDGLGRVAFNRGEPATTRLLSLMQIDTIVLPRYQHTYDPGLPILSREDAEEARSLPGQQSEFRTVIGVTPRAWLVRRIRQVEGKMRLASVLAAPDFDPRQEAVLSGKGAERLVLAGGGVSPSESESRNEVRFLSQSSTKLEMQVECGASPAYLVYCGAAYPGWTAQVDGHRQPLLRTDVALMGLPLSPGKHEVKLEFQPVAFRFGAYLSLLAVSLFTALVVRLSALRFLTWHSRSKTTVLDRSR